LVIRFIMIWRRTREVAGGRQGFVVTRPVYADITVGGAHREQPCGAAGDVGEIDRLGFGAEIRPLDRLQVDEIIDEGQEVAAGRCDVRGVAGIIAAKRAFGLGTKPLGIVDDMGERRAKGLIEPLSERRSVMRRRPGGIVGDRTVRLRRGLRRRRRESRRSGPCHRSGERRKAHSARGGRRAAPQSALRTPYARQGRSGSEARRPRFPGIGTSGSAAGR
jgi:hypothetical protein